MDKKALLLNNSYEVLSFVSTRRAIKLLIKGKVETISYWDDVIIWESGRMQFPSILRLKNQIKRNYVSLNFSRNAVIKRDHSSCQYCNKKLSASILTIDHILPKSRGGITSFTNCVVCCKICNTKKGSKTLAESNMVLLTKPTHPSFTNEYCLDNHKQWHSDWDDFLIKT